MRNVCELIYDFMIYLLLQSHVKYLDLLQYNAGFSMQCFAAICTMVTSNSVTKDESLSECCCVFIVHCDDCEQQK